MAFVYILYSEKRDRYYIGSTPDIQRRIEDHNDGHSLATKNGVPWKIVFVHQISTLPDARRLEYRLKQFKNRKIIEQIVLDQAITSRILMSSAG